jgi:WhiB family redox-sensing transcriptional regulator
MTNNAANNNTAAPGHSSLGDFIHAAPEMPWLDDAACGSLPLEQLNFFFVEAGRTIAASTVAMCRQCPVRQQCLAHAYSNEIASGYFGGVSPGQRRVLSYEEASALISAE